MDSVGEQQEERDNMVSACVQGKSAPSSEAARMLWKRVRDTTSSIVLITSVVSYAPESQRRP